MTDPDLGMEFSTRDEDNDVWPGGSCAELYHGGWWYERCGHSNLNGRYHRLGGAHMDGVWWFDWERPHYSLRFTQMKIRPH